MKKILPFFISFLFSFLISSAQGLWTQRANFGGAGRYMPVAFSIGTKAFVGTGFSSSGQTNDFWEWDQTTDTWTQIANFPAGNNAQCAGFAMGLKGYVLPGTTGAGQVWEYDPTINSWTQKANFAGVGQYNAVTFTIGTKAYLGACGSNYNNSDFWEYDAASDAWTQKANFGGGIRSHATGFAIGPKGYIGTGRDGNSTYFNDLWAYDPTTNSWTQKANLPGAPRDYAAGLSIGGKGYLGTGGSNSADWYRYDPVTDTWTAMANIPNGGTTTVITFTIGNKGYLACGQDGTGNSRALWEFDPQDTAMSLFSGKVFLDSNANCVMDGNDSPLLNWFVQAQNNFITDIRYGSTDVNGNYNIWVPSGNYSLSLIPKPYWNQICPVSPPIYNSSVAPNDTVNNLNFGASIGSYCPDLAIGIGASSYRKCRRNSFYVQYWNNGTVTAFSPMLKIDFDPNIIPLSSTVPWDSVSVNSYFWKIDSVRSCQYVSFNITDSVSCNVQVGDSLFAGAEWMNITNDCNYQNNGVKYHHVVTASHDPNSKEAFTSSNDMYNTHSTILASDTINYAIHFQNTGTDTAFTVVVYDTLDTHLDPTSVITTVSSHPYTFQLLGSGVLKWTFNNILLPDSTVNELASNGFIEFQILQKPGNTFGTVIKNSAAIVFDLNLPVITDTVLLTIASPEAVYNINEIDHSISVYPNPTTGLFLIVCEGKHSQLEIYNVLGEKVFRSESSEMRSEVDLRNKPKGIYLLRAVVDGRTYTKKIIIQ